jgi:CheY-like chemotaxis protein
MNAAPRPKVLVVDDQPVNVRALAALLQPDAETLFATDGIAALAKAREHSPDLILLDVDMPGMDGYEVCRHLKADPATAEIPVVFVTGMAQAEDEERGLSLGAIDYVTKPFQPAIVKVRVKNHLELKRSRDALVESYRKLEAAQASLVQAEKMASLGQLVAGVAHEINTPMGIALTAASHVTDRAGELEEKFRERTMSRSDLEAFLALQRESGPMILGGLSRSAALVQRFKQMAVDQAQDRLAEIDVAVHLQESTRLWTAENPGSAVRVSVSAPAGVSIQTFPTALTRLLHALLDNVRVHAYPGDSEGEASVTAVPANGGGVVVTVADRGAGIRPDVAAKVFDPFFTTRRGDGSVGLGLAIAFNLVTSTLRGRIDVASVPGAGATFRVALPARVTSSSA